MGPCARLLTAVILSSSVSSAVADLMPLEGRPVAVAEASALTVPYDPADAASGSVTFSHAGSYHEDPVKAIVDYRWIFDSWLMVPDFTAFDWLAIPDGGFDASGHAYRTTSRAAQPRFQFAGLGVHNVGLQVVDNSSPLQSSMDVIQLRLVPVPEPGPVSLLLAAVCAALAPRWRTRSA